MIAVRVRERASKKNLDDLARSGFEYTVESVLTACGSIHAAVGERWSAGLPRAKRSG